jgi:CDP-glucose 4,6-dehydratase
VPDKKFWKNKNVLITGFTGFLGSNLTNRLLDYGACIVGLDISPYRKQAILSDKNLARIKIVKGSVENFPLVSRIIKSNKIEFVFHLAARALVAECFKKPIETFSTNIEGTWNILEASRRSEIIKAIIIASSDKAYGSHKKLPYAEDAPLIGRHPYDVSKSCADLIARSYFKIYKVPVVITRCGNIYGPGDFNFSRIIPDAVRCALTGKTLLIRSDGKFTRDYVFVEDIVNGYLTIVENMRKLGLGGEAFNFSNENPINVINLVKKIYKIAHKPHNYQILNQAKYEIKHQYLSSRKAKTILGWEPRNNLDEGLRKTINWYKLIIIFSEQMDGMTLTLEILLVRLWNQPRII